MLDTLEQPVREGSKINNYFFALVFTSRFHRPFYSVLTQTRIYNMWHHCKTPLRELPGRHISKDYIKCVKLWVETPFKPIWTLNFLYQLTSYFSQHPCTYWWRPAYLPRSPSPAHLFPGYNPTPRSRCQPWCLAVCSLWVETSPTSQ